MKDQWLFATLKKSALESNETRLESDFLKSIFYERRSLLIERHKIIRLVKHVLFKRLERQVVLILSVKNLAQPINTFWTKILKGPVEKALVGGRALKKWSILELHKRKVRFQNKLVKLKQVGLSTYMWKAMRALMWGDISPYWEVVIYTL